LKKAIRIAGVLLAGALLILGVVSSTEANAGEGPQPKAIKQDEPQALEEPGEKEPQLPHADWVEPIHTSFINEAEAAPAPAATARVLAEIAHPYVSQPYEIAEETRYQYSEEEKVYIARTVYAESRGEVFEGQVAVATVIMNRFESGKFGDSVKRVVFARNQFAVSKKYDDEIMKAVDAAIQRRGDFPEDLYYFQVSKRKKWYSFRFYARIGNHNFFQAPLPK